jgi:serine/threonine protein kinase
MVGRTLGHYEITEPLGFGGMGEVYRARDTKLERDVALKFLPEDVAKDEARLARFEREAKVLASLNHANIAAIYGLENFDGVRFIAMELVEGETLADRLAASGRMDIEEALAVAAQIAEAVEAAHESGVIHRDLKPANVKIAPGGKVKVLDFGLAKASGPDGSPAASSPDLSKSPTMTPATEAGIILGTAAYMSPEQARGRPLDKRTDIWSFGCVLYELLAGRPAFGGETVSDTIAAVLEREPDWEALPPDTPDLAQAVLRRCFRKAPDRRLHDIADARIEIEDALRDEPGEPVVSARTQRPASTAARPWRTALIVGAAAVFGLLAIVFWPSPPEEPLIYLMDTTAPLGVYDAQTRSRGGTNADDLSDLLGDLPVSIARETLSPLWHREHEVMSQQPRLILVHRSAFAHQPGIEDPQRQTSSRDALGALGLEDPYELGWSKLIGFLGYVSLGSPDTEYFIYSRGFGDEATRQRWVDSVATRFPQLEGKIATYSVPLDEDGNASFRDPATGAEVKQLVEAILGLH